MTPFIQARALIADGNVEAVAALIEALTDCNQRLRSCARLHGNGRSIIDIMCKPYDAALASLPAAKREGV